MRILDKNNNEIENPDLEKGYLKTETIVIKHHEAVEAKQGKSHIEVVKEYDNGGKDVITVWDEKPTEAVEKIANAKEETANKEAKLSSLYNADMTFSDVVDAIAELAYGGTK